MSKRFTSISGNKYNFTTGDFFETHEENKTIIYDTCGTHHFIPPPNTCKMHIKLWGGGGGSVNELYKGYSGNFVSFSTSVDATKSYYIIVGKGGLKNNYYDKNIAGKGGSPSSKNGTYSGGGGGDSTLIFEYKSNMYSLIACAGGGGGASNISNELLNGQSGSNGKGKTNKMLTDSSVYLLAPGNPGSDMILESDKLSDFKGYGGSGPSNNFPINVGGGGGGYGGGSSGSATVNAGGNGGNGGNYCRYDSENIILLNGKNDGEITNPLLTHSNYNTGGSNSNGSNGLVIITYYERYLSIENLQINNTISVNNCPNRHNIRCVTNNTVLQPCDSILLINSPYQINVTLPLPTKYEKGRHVTIKDIGNGEILINCEKKIDKIHENIKINNYDYQHFITDGDFWYTC